MFAFLLYLPFLCRGRGDDRGEGAPGAEGVSGGYPARRPSGGRGQDPGPGTYVGDKNDLIASMLRWLVVGLVRVLVSAVRFRELVVVGRRDREGRDGGGTFDFWFR